MKLKTVITYVRLKRGPIAALFIVAAMLLGLVFLSATLYFLVILLETQSLHGRQTSEGTGGIICLFSWVGLGLVTLSIGLYTFSHRCITFTTNLALALRAHQKGQFDEEYSYAREAWNYAERLAPDDPFRGRVLEQLTRVARALGNYDDVESFGLQWITAEERAWGSEHPAATYAMAELATAYIDIARYAQAKPLLEKALSFWESTRRPDPAALAFCLGSMGRLWQELARYDKAEPYLRRAIEMMQSLPERTSHGVIISLSLTVACVKNGKIDDAESTVQSTRGLIENSLPPESWQSAYCIYSLSHVRYAQQHYAEAEDLTRRSLAMMERTWSSDDPRLFGWWASLGSILKSQEKWAESENCFRKALQLCENCCAPEHPQIAEILEDYAGLLQRLGRTGEAFEHHHRAAHIREFHSPLRIV